MGVAMSFSLVKTAKSLELEKSDENLLGIARSDSAMHRVAWEPLLPAGSALGLPARATSRAHNRNSMP